MPDRGCRAGGLSPREGWKPCSEPPETLRLTPLASLLAASLPPIDLESENTVAAGGGIGHLARVDLLGLE